MSAAQDPIEYWGYMIRADRAPSELFDLLLRGIANFIVSGGIGALNE
jgi:hypothetical protein